LTNGVAADAAVKWFNAEKGFGFVELADGSGDAFLHISVLQAAGHGAVEPGTTLKVEVARGQKGRQISAVLGLDASAAAVSAPRPHLQSAPERLRPDPATAIDVSGVVKWFNPEKGFGFVAADGGGKDIFIHIAVLEKSGSKTLPEGARVSMRVVQGHKGPEALSIRLI
jgi:CspA family cold shock protein